MVTLCWDNYIDAHALIISEVEVSWFVKTTTTPLKRKNLERDNSQAMNCYSLFNQDIALYSV